MADSATTPEEPVVMDGDVIVEFNEASSRQQINSGESVKTLFGKIRKFLTDFKAVAFSGAYSDLSGVPDLSEYATNAELDNKAEKELYGDTTINVGRKANSVVGDFSAAEGYDTTASEFCSHAEGENTTASGHSSHAEGGNTTASGNYSHAGGTGTKALHTSEVAYGRYNKSNSDTLFSIGDGTADDARHNAFEITTTGGKLHDKDIATTDLIPSSLPANGGNADTVGGKLPEKIFYDNGMSSDLDSATESGCYAASPDTLNVPYSSWWVVDTMNYNGQFIVQKAHMIGSASTTVSYIRNYANSAWSDWTEIYTAGNKPYVTGVVTISGANDTDNLFRIETNHGFAPSWALCCNIADNIVYCCALSSDNPTRFIYLRSTEAIKNGDIFEYIIFR